MFTPTPPTHQAHVAFGPESVRLGVLDDAVTRLTLIEEQARALEAERVRVLAEIHGIIRDECADAGDTGACEGTLAFRAVRAEIAAALTQSEQTTERQLTRAAHLTERYAATVEGVAAAEISPQHAQVLADAGAIIGSASINDDPLTAKRRQEYESRVLEIAKGTTPGRLKPFARRIAEEYAAESLDDRYERVKTERRVWVQEREDGMADLTAYLPAHEAFAVYSRLTRMAKHIQRVETRHAAKLREAAKARGEAGQQSGAEPGAESGAEPGATFSAEPGTEFQRRSRDEIRADLLLDLLGQSVGDEELTRNERPGGDEGASDTGAGGTGVGDTGQPIGRLQGVVQVIVSAEHLATPLDPQHDPPGDDPPGTDPPGDALPGTDPPGAAAPPDPPPQHQQSEPTRSSPPWLEGYGPIPVAIAREIAGDAWAWDIVTTHPGTGQVLEVQRYRPSEAIKRFIFARDQHCRFPGCGIPVHRCDIDHTVDAALDGPTATTNLGAVCRGHHTVKHHTGWEVEQHEDGDYVWRSPTGRVHREKAPSRVRFKRFHSSDPMRDDQQVF